jgi:histidyl-tRNA synthetase
MIFEHEIPSGSKLYFGESAKIKREIEFVSSEILENLGFEEIVTPVFSYHQHEYFDDKKPLIRLNDAENHEVTLRADSTADVVRIVTKRLGRSTESKKWFYIQPTLSFPTREQYQIGAEVIDGEFATVAKTAMMLLGEIGIEPIMQISNIRIPQLLNEKYEISLEILKSMNLEKLLEIGPSWIEALSRINRVEDLEDLTPFPDDIRTELEALRANALSIDHSHAVLSPLFYAKMRYYDSMTFRMFLNNDLFAMGGTYNINGIEAAGFALYTDECVCYKMDNKAANE